MALILQWSKRLLLKQCGVCAAIQNRWASTVPAPTLVCERLQNRGLLQVKGIDASRFLQGLITNDMHHFDGFGAKSPSMYAMILNVQGQVLYDIIIYHLRNGSDRGHHDFLVECDITGVQELTKLFTMYRIRKKVELIDVSDKYVPWVAFCPPVDDVAVNENERAEKVKPNMLEPSKITIMSRDPRMLALGWRVILPTDIAPNEVLKVSQIGKDKSLGYHKLRYKLGVGEGLADLPPGRCYPLESNADYLHGVSFHKGCYVGQELTARTHHTGVIRKRLMPILFTSNVGESIAYDTVLENEKGRNVGRFVNREGQFGLGLMRIQECLSAEAIQVKQMGVPLTTRRPEWWPVEQPKESLAAREKIALSKASVKESDAPAVDRVDGGLPNLVQISPVTIKNLIPKIKKYLFE